MADNSPNTLTLPNKTAQAPETERMVEVELLSDVWIEDKNSSDSIGGILRVRTNIPVLDEDGNPKINKASKSPMVTLSKVMLPVSMAKKLISEGKANRIDPL